MTTDTAPVDGATLPSASPTDSPFPLPAPPEGEGLPMTDLDPAARTGLSLLLASCVDRDQAAVTQILGELDDLEKVHHVLSVVLIVVDAVFDRDLQRREAVLSALFAEFAPDPEDAL